MLDAISWQRVARSSTARRPPAGASLLRRRRALASRTPREPCARRTAGQLGLLHRHAGEGVGDLRGLQLRVGAQSLAQVHGGDVRGVGLEREPRRAIEGRRLYTPRCEDPRRCEAPPALPPGNPNVWAVEIGWAVGRVGKRRSHPRAGGQVRRVGRADRADGRAVPDNQATWGNRFGRSGGSAGLGCRRRRWGR